MGSGVGERARGCNDLPCLVLFLAYVVALVVTCALEVDSGNLAFLEYGWGDGGLCGQNGSAPYLWFPLAEGGADAAAPAAACVGHCPNDALSLTGAFQVVLDDIPVTYPTFPRHRRCLPAAGAELPAQAGRIREWTMLDDGGFVAALELRAAAPALAVAAGIAVFVAAVWVIAAVGGFKAYVIMTSFISLFLLLVVAGTAAVLHSDKMRAELQAHGEVDARDFWLAAGIVHFLLAAALLGIFAVVLWPAAKFVTAALSAAAGLLDHSIGAALTAPLLTLPAYVGATALCFHAALSTYANQAEAEFAGGDAMVPEGFIAFIFVGWLWVAWFLQSLTYQAVAVSVIRRYMALETTPTVLAGLGMSLSFYIGSLAFGAILAPLQPLRAVCRLFGDGCRASGCCCAALLDGFLHKYSDMNFAVQALLGDDPPEEGRVEAGEACAPAVSGYARAGSFVPQIFLEDVPMVFARQFEVAAFLSLGKYAVTWLALAFLWPLLGYDALSAAETYLAPLAAAFFIVHGAVSIILAPLLAAADAMLLCYSYDTAFLNSASMPPDVRNLRGMAGHGLPEPGSQEDVTMRKVNADASPVSSRPPFHSQPNTARGRDNSGVPSWGGDAGQPAPQWGPGSGAPTPRAGVPEPDIAYPSWQQPQHDAAHGAVCHGGESGIGMV
eukprot:TRINITY_DN3185_c0_g1_i1.p1 TRINITY_DN3185_c0_g1~~TRINITY_DN3185_c0_g1_i1.p1  ORF type:complete len:667 (+),score=218.35 TRINITY_DN3185_c0_g1_i1:89-2089(+)